MTSSPTPNTKAPEGAGYPDDIVKAAVAAYDAPGEDDASLNSLVSKYSRDRVIAVIARAILAERERSQSATLQRIRPHLRDCQFCKAKGSDPEIVHFTAETDVVDQFEYGFTIRCIGCGVSISDEYEDEVIRLWNGEDKPAEED